MGSGMMAIVDMVISPNYWIKSILKLSIFIGIPLLLNLRFNYIPFKKVFFFQRHQLRIPMLLAVGVYVVIVTTYLFIGELFDFSNVTRALETDVGVTKANFIFVAIYISLINALVEEFFFRGIAFISLKNESQRHIAYSFSSIAFSLYHVGIMYNWFEVSFFLLLMFALICAGLLFNWLNDHFNSLYPSWLVHACANLAINTIGLLLFSST